MDTHRLRPLALAAVLALAGCGATPPQAPGPEAHRLNEALSSLSDACGEASELEPFEPSSPLIARLDAKAASHARTLAQIYKRNRNWVFQGKNVAQLVAMSEKFLDDCGLHGAARSLRAATAG